VANPIDFLATGNAEQLGAILDACEHEFDAIDATAVIFGNPGLFDVSDVYDVLDAHMRTCSKPIYPILPSVINASSEISRFLDRGRVAFFDEVAFARALGAVYRTPAPRQDRAAAHSSAPPIDRSGLSADRYLPPPATAALLDWAGIPRVPEHVATNAGDAADAAARYGFPVVVKVVGLVHKSDVGGVAVGIPDVESVRREAARMLAIPDATGVLIQPQIDGLELFAGAIREGDFGVLVLAGLGGIFVETFGDVVRILAPFDRDEALAAIGTLRGYPLLAGTRGQPGIDIDAYADLLVSVGSLAVGAQEIAEMDLNPILATRDALVAVDARIRIER
jgi:acetyltransferase